MDTSEHESSHSLTRHTSTNDLILKDEVYEIIGSAMEILNEINFSNPKLEWERIVL